MPLIRSGSKSAVSANISELMHTGKYPQKQAVAIAMSNARKYASGGVPLPRPNPLRPPPPEPDEPRDFGEPTWPDPGDKPLERYPTKDDAAFARQQDMSYGRPDAAFFNNERYNMLAGNPNNSPIRMRAVDAKETHKYRDTNYAEIPGFVVRNAMDEYYARAALAAQRSPLATLGFDPTKSAADVTRNPENVNILGTYKRKADEIYANARNPSTLVHESIHRGLKKLRDGPFWKPEFERIFNLNEDTVRYLMTKKMGDPEANDSGSIGQEQRKAANYLFNEGLGSYKLRSLLDEVETAAAKQIAMTKPGGPRASGGRVNAFAAGGSIGRYAAGGSPWEERASGRALTHEGMIKSPVPGRTDALPITVGGGAYILPADHLAAIGQGNSMAGGQIANQMLGLSKKGGLRTPRAIIHHQGRMKMPKIATGGAAPDVPIVAAGGEYVVPPEKVREIGGGDMERGHKVLDAWVLSTRKKHIKTLKGLRPPKK